MNKAHALLGRVGLVAALAIVCASACGEGPARPPCRGGAQIGAEGSRFVLRKGDGTQWTWGAGESVPQPVTTNVSPSATFVRGTLCVNDPGGAVSCPFFADSKTVTMTYPGTFKAPARDVSILGSYGFTDEAASLCVVFTSSQMVCRFRGAPELVDDVGPGFIMAAVGSWVACGLGEDGTVACRQLLGDASAPSGLRGEPWGTAAEWAAALGAEKAVEIVSTEGTPCVLTDGRAVVCQGGQHGFQFPEGAPARMDGFTPPVAALTAGSRHVCAIVKDGDVVCWGAWRVENRLIEPTKIAGLPHPAVALASANDSDCAILDDTSVWCWGALLDGARGSPGATPLEPFTPTPVTTCE